MCLYRKCEEWQVIQSQVQFQSKGLRFAQNSYFYELNARLLESVIGSMTRNGANKGDRFR